MNIQRIRRVLRFAWSELNRNAARIDRDPLLTKLDMLWCALRYGAVPGNYVNFEFHRATGKERRTFVTHRASEHLMRKYNQNAHVDLLRNKYTFSQKFAPWFGRECMLSKGCTEQFLSAHAGEQVIYKPLRGGQGQGIKVFDVEDPSLLSQAIRQLPDGVVESWITQHPAMQEFYPHSINPIRIQTIHRDGHTVCLCATVTVGRDARFANASSHALFALVDVKTGTVFTDGCDYDGNFYSVHPQTRIPFRGFVIPHWQELLDTVCAAAREIPSIGYIGWDVAITDSGVALIEGNNDPGYTAYQLPRLTGKRTGSLDLYKPYL